MVRTKLYIGVIILSLAALLAGACTSQPSLPPGSEVRNAAEARDTAIAYLRTYVVEDAPAADIEWEEENVTPPGLVGSTIVAFTPDEWTITMSYPIVPPQNAVY